MDATLPSDHLIRAPRHADAEAVLAVMLARDVADIGRPDFTLEDVRADWATPGLDIGRDEDGVGYVAQFAVAPRARGEGHGRELLLALFAAFRAAGLRTAELSVHGANRGAARLYESVGMHPSWEAERWEKALGHA